MPDSGREGVLSRIVEIARNLPVQVVEGINSSLEELPKPPNPSGFDSALAGVPNPDVRGELRDMFHQWIAACPEETGATLAWALRGAVATNRWWRASTHSELVWTGPAPSQGVLRRTEQALHQVISAAESELWLVSFAGYKFAGLSEALVAAADRGVQIRMIIESPETSKGKLTYSNLSKLGKSLGNAATVYVWPREKRKPSEQGKTGVLHVKAGLADEKLLFVTSANLTGSAMHLNMEMGVLLGGGESPRRAAEHFRWLIQEKYLVAVKE